MNLEIKTQIKIEATPEKVWEVLMNFSEHPTWNPFIKEISGKASKGEILNVELGGMKFKPEVKELKLYEEFRWKGKLLINGLFDGEHQFLLRKNEDDSTVFEQNEKFSGLLVSLFKNKLLKETKDSFVEMNQALKLKCEN